MRILIVGGTGLIGKAVAKELKKLDHEVLIASRSDKKFSVDLSSPTSIERMYQQAPGLDAVISVPASNSRFAPVSELSPQDMEQGLQVKCLGQINLVLIGQKYLNKEGSFTLTTGILSTDYIPNASISCTINNAVEGFVKSASLDLSNHLRLNAVSPNVITEALDRLGDTFKGYKGVSLHEAALGYVRAVEGIINGHIIRVW